MADTLNSIVDRSISEFEDDKIKRVGKNAFRGCEVLSSVTLPSVRAIGDKAFKDCTSLEDISVGDNYDGVVSVNDDSFDGCNPINVIVPKDKVDLYKNSDSWSGFVKKGLTVNWGKCGGSSDVIVTYKEGEGLWVPKAFLEQAFDKSDGATSILKTPPADSSIIGYQGSYFMDGGSGNGIILYKLPQNLGEWLYNNSESMPTSGRYGSSSTSDQVRIYRGIAIYPDNPSAWTSSQGWGIGIRKKSDILVHGHSSSGTPVENSFYTSHTGASLEDNSYYMVAQYYITNSFRNDAEMLEGQLTLFSSCVGDDTGSDHIWLRHCKDMDSVPSSSNKGSKYLTPSDLCTYESGTQGSIYGMKDSVTINWGKDSSNNDIITTFKRGDELYIPRAFLTKGFNSTFDGHTANDTSTDVGYKGYFEISAGYWGLDVYKLPQGLGEWLYNNAETGVAYSDTAYNLYKGIAMYPDNSSTWTASSTKTWGVGIRKKSDINVDRTGASPVNITTNGLEDDAYYLVAQDGSSRSYWSIDNSLMYQLKERFKSVSDDNGSDHIYLRHFKGMTSAPSATNKGEKYTIDSYLKSLTLPLTVNWGKCGGTEDVIVNYDKDEGLWIPKEFLTQGWGSTYSPKADALFLSDGVTKDTSVGYKTWFGWGDKGDVTTRQSISYSELYVTVYKLPQSLGEYLYNNAESHISGISNYINTVHGSTENYLYKGIAIYPDTLKSSGWSYVKDLGIGIRKKNDIPIVGLDSDYAPTTSDINATFDYSAIYNLSQWKALEDDAYYLVCQGCLKNHINWNSQIPYLIDTYFDDGNIYFRHWNTLTSAPTATLSTHGKKYDVPISLPPDNARPLGGKIFYIDPTDNGATYTFYDASGKKISGTTASELASAKYYVKSGTSTADKFYAYLDTGINATWTYVENSAYVYGNISTSDSIGTGKANTQTVMAVNDGIYISVSASGTRTIWHVCNEANKDGRNGCSDWFIPSRYEVEALNLTNVWSSSQYRDSEAYAFLSTGVIRAQSKGNSCNCILTRSF